MSEHSLSADLGSEGQFLSTDLGPEGQFALERRGYNRMQVDEAIAQLTFELRSLQDSRRDLEDRLGQALDDGEGLRRELSASRSASRPPHQELSDRISKILELADDEASALRAKASEEITRLRAEAQAETARMVAEAKAAADRMTAEARQQADRKTAEAQQQADRALAAAREQAETIRAAAGAEAGSARAKAADEAQHVLSEASRQAELTLSGAKSHAKQQLDEATARATAIHDGAERRLNLLMSRHAETLRRMTEIRDVVTTLVASEAERGSLADEVERRVGDRLHSGPQSGPHPVAGSRSGTIPSGRAARRAPAGPGEEPPAGPPRPPVLAGRDQPADPPPAV